MEKLLKKAIAPLVVLAVFCATAISCGQSAEVEERAYLRLNYTEISLNVGESITIVPRLKKTDVKPVYSFYSADSGVAIVDEDGTVFGVGEGQTTVRVQTSEHTASCKVIVIKRTV